MSSQQPVPYEGRSFWSLTVLSLLMGDNLLTKSAARVRLDSRGIVTVETDMTDIGTGSYTIIAQTAAEMMGVTLDKVVVRLGDSTFPVAAGAGGQWAATTRRPATMQHASSCAKR